MMGSREPLFLQMHPNLVPHLKLVRNSMLVVSLIVFGINIFSKFNGLIVSCVESIQQIEWPC